MANAIKPNAFDVYSGIPMAYPNGKHNKPNAVLYIRGYSNGKRNKTNVLFVIIRMANAMKTKYFCLFGW